MACNAHNGGCSQLCNALPEGKQTYPGGEKAGEGREEGTQRSLIRGGSPPRSRKCTPFVCLLLTNRTLFAYLVKYPSSLPVRHCTLFILILTDELRSLERRNYGISSRKRNERRVWNTRFSKSQKAALSD